MLRIVDKEKNLMHIVYRLQDLENIQREEVIPPNNFLQLSALNIPEGKTFIPHKHIWKDGEKTVKAQESWVVIKGQVEVFYYDEDNLLLDSITLNPGDVSVTLHGGHNYLASKDSLVYEYKTGPYKGQKLDKVLMDV